MAGRGTDIVLGGNPEFMAAAEAGTRDPMDPGFQAALEKYRKQCAAEREQVLKAGGLHILGTERHESRRIDNQLRGRSGRQGDPGSSRFYISLEDDLLRIFGADRLKGLMGKMGMEDGVPIEHRWISRAIENAQKKVESHNFDIRKHLLEYDDVMNKQREVVYHRRRELLSPQPLKEDVLGMCEAAIEEIIAAHCDLEKDPEQWDWPEIENAFLKQFRYRPNLKEIALAKDVRHPDELIELAEEPIRALYDAREAEFSPEVMRQIEKIVSLQTLDSLWKDHLLAMDHLKEGIGLRGYAQQNPLVEYQKEGFTMFGALMEVMQKDIVEKVFSVQVQKPQDVQQVQQQQAARPPRVTMSHGAEVQQAQPAQAKREPDRVGRNDPCPCGSGKKYKRCHGK
jgi:preprotein translocase subunit SecA